MALYSPVLSFAVTYLSILVLIINHEVVSLHIILHPVGTNTDNLVVFDTHMSRTFCYPNLSEAVDLDHEHLPSRDKNHGLDPLHAITHLNNIARVICREVSGYTHLESVYPVPSPPDLANSTKRVKWLAECIGYEPLLSHCFTFNVSEVDSKCNDLLGIKCGHCSKKLKLNTGESLVITSPEYPNYSDDVICEWHIDMQEAVVIEVNFSEFSLPPRNEKGDCHRGSLGVSRIKEGHEQVTEVTTIQTMCGSAIPDNITFNAKGALIRFYAGLFIPRPIGEKAGFNLTISALGAAPITPLIAKDENGLNMGETLAVIFACTLVIFVAIYISQFVRRFLKEQRRTLRHRVMEERLATQRQGRQEVALTAMLAERLQNISASSHQGLQCPMGPPEDHKDFPPWRNKGVSDNEATFRKTRSQSWGHYIFSGIPTTSAPPPPPQMNKQMARKICSQTLIPECSDEPDYLEPEMIDRSFSYLDLDSINLGSLTRSTPNHVNEYVNIPTHGASCSNLDVRIRRLSTVSSSAHNMTSYGINLWPSTPSLAPSNKTVPLLPQKGGKTTHFSFPTKSCHSSSTVDSFSFHSGSVSPFPGHTPNISRCQSSLSQVSICVHPGCSQSQQSLSYSSDIDNKSPNLLVEKNTNLTQMTPASSLYKTPEQGDFSFDSSDSVFGTGGGTSLRKSSRRSILPERLWQSQSHISKSCSDVSSKLTLAKCDPILEDLNQSLPGDQSTVANIVKPPFLRRVSQMFSGSHLTKLNASRTSNQKNLINFAVHGDNQLENKGSGHGISSNKTSESSLRKISKTTSPRRQPSLSVSSASFNHYKYNRMESVHNVDLDALLPRSFSPEPYDNNILYNDRESNSLS